MRITIESNGKTEVLDFTTVSLTKSIGKTKDAPCVNMVVDFSDVTAADMKSDILRKCVAVAGRDMMPVNVSLDDASLNLLSTGKKSTKTKGAAPNWTIENIFNVTPDTTFLHNIKLDATPQDALNHCLQFVSIDTLFNGLRGAYAHHFAK